MSDETNTTVTARERESADLPEQEAPARRIAVRTATAKRFSRSDIGPDHDGDASTTPERAEPFVLQQWAQSAARGLLDIRFQRTATSTLLPLAYVLGSVCAVVLPCVLVVLVWRWSTVWGVLAALVAVPLGVTLAAAVRLTLEFLVHAARLANRVEHMGDLADDLFHALSEVAEPVNQLSEDVRAVQFWRFRRGGSRR
ncbi:DUF4282 domain-containing protein [Nocardia callitridis]|uniref:DUF4282 domain-containing protein n=1 Tax=Nocardia callitridis TaxID=648753 RepID=A0ABP9K232_9NOCA